MGSNHYTLLFTILFIFFLGSIFLDISPALGGKTINDDWTPIENPNDPEVRSGGKFAVDEHNSHAQTSLVFDNVVDGETKFDGGTHYNMTITAKDGDTIRKYLVHVIDRPYQNGFVLVSFKGPID